MEGVGDDAIPAPPRDSVKMTYDLAVGSPHGISPAAFKMELRKEALIQNSASSSSRSRSGVSAETRPRSFASSRMPSNPTGFNPRATAAARPASSSMSTASAFRCTASDRAAISPAWRRLIAVRDGGISPGSQRSIKEGKSGSENADPPSRAAQIQPPRRSGRQWFRTKPTRVPPAQSGTGSK
jgi:hypothetical protein